MNLNFGSTEKKKNERLCPVFGTGTGLASISVINGIHLTVIHCSDSTCKHAGVGISLGQAQSAWNKPHSLSDEVKGLSPYPEPATGIVDDPDATRGKKFDDNKSRFHLMPRQAEQEVVDVLTYGAIKYDEYNWQKVEPLNDRYYSAARRHMQAFMNGERRDIESGLHHLAHAACCLLFMLENDLQHELPESVKHQAS